MMMVVVMMASVVAGAAVTGWISRSGVVLSRACLLETKRDPVKNERGNAMQAHPKI
jgi:hypothetical protein